MERGDLINIRLVLTPSFIEDAFIFDYIYGKGVGALLKSI
jgi:hypothetical protein